MPTSAARIRALADACRSLAQTTDDPHVREDLLAIAMGYDREADGRSDADIHPAAPAVVAATP